MDTEWKLEYFGNLEMAKAYCPFCEMWAFVQGTRLQCCDRIVVVPDYLETEVKAPHRNYPKRLAIPAYVKDSVLSKQGKICVYCDKPLERIHFDHFMPWSVSQDNSEENIVATCTTCNLRKSAHVFDSIDEVRDYLKVRYKNREDKKDA